MPPKQQFQITNGQSKQFTSILILILFILHDSHPTLFSIHFSIIIYYITLYIASLLKKKASNHCFSRSSKTNWTDADEDFRFGSEIESDNSTIEATTKVKEPNIEDFDFGEEGDSVSSAIHH